MKNEGDAIVKFYFTILIICFTLAILNPIGVALYFAYQCEALEEVRE